MSAAWSTFVHAGLLMVVGNYRGGPVTALVKCVFCQAGMRHDTVLGVDRLEAITHVGRRFQAE